MKVSIEIPDSIALAIRGTEQHLQETIKMSLAIKFYEDKILSLGESALLADINKIDFMDYLNKKGISILNFNDDNDNTAGYLEQDLNNARMAVNINE